LLDVIGSWRREQDRLRLCAAAKDEWLAFGGFATRQQPDAWDEKFGAWYLGPGNDTIDDQTAGAGVTQRRARSGHSG
jgi:hypothetical protein